ncbi:MAG: glycine cleavage system aminomethyltransferase GcvT, partial [Actinobacteria bacterium]|nr:glycine cleavage system aminomethyltransferase GcvT [Actinomycetota bacterium]
MTELRRVALHENHLALGAKMTDFAGWAMPLMYPTGVIGEHLATRSKAGLFDVSHMGRFAFRGSGALGLLQYALSNNAAALDVGQAQYSFIPTETGGAVDDVYLYRFFEDEYLLVVNAANKEKDWEHLESLRMGASSASPVPGPVEMHDRTDELVMLALQGPLSREILTALIENGRLPEPRRNQLSVVTMAGVPILVGRTGYTGEPLGFELFVPRDHGAVVWDLLIEKGAVPCGLGSRDTLRLEAGLPLYGHELGADMQGTEIPLFSSPLASFAVSFSPVKGDYVGREALIRQQAAYRRVLARDYSLVADLPRMTRPVAVVGKGVPRPGSPVMREGRGVGWVTSGTMVPYWQMTGLDLESHPGNE